MSPFSNIILKVLANAIKQEKQVKKESMQIGEEEIKLSVFTNNMIIYVDNPLIVYKKLLELMSEFS